MNKKMTSLGLALVAVVMLVGAGCSKTTPVVDTNGTYTLAEIATHKDATSCWTAVRGQVYDLTSWIIQHPGGAENILSVCGKDGTAAFTAQHNGQREPESELKSFHIGTLAS